MVSVRGVMKILGKVTTLFRDDTKSPTRTRPIEYHRNSAEDVRPQIVLAPVVPAAAVASSEQQAVRQAAAGVDDADSLAVSDQRLAVEQQIRSRTHREVAAVQQVPATRQRAGRYPLGSSRPPVRGRPA